MFILLEAKANQTTGKIHSVGLFGLKLLAKLSYRTLVVFGGIELVHTKWHISLLQYVILFLLISVAIKLIPSITYLAQK
jgi:hypothetical protein